MDVASVDGYPIMVESGTILCSDWKTINFTEYESFNARVSWQFSA